MSTSRTLAPRTLLRSLLPLALLVLLGGCASEDAGSWRDLAYDLPEGWTVYERGSAHLSAASAPIGEEDPDPGPGVVAVQFTHDPAASLPGAWRDFLAEEGADIEEDRSGTLDGVPTTTFVYRLTTNGITTREMLTVVPSRELYILMQPVPRAGDTDAPEVFRRNRDAFESILASIDFGAPIEEAAGTGSPFGHASG